MSPEHGAALAELFARADVACHCRYFHFAGTTNDWLGRCAHAPEQNRAEMLAAVDEASPEMHGVVALDGRRVIGWLKLAPAEAVPKLYAQRIYRRLPCFDGPRDAVLAIGCMLVDPEHRRRGVAQALLRGAIEVGRARHARALEAFPRRAEGLRDEEVFTGPFSAFLEAGFRIVHDFPPYPVLRLDLS